MLVFGLVRREVGARGESKVRSDVLRVALFEFIKAGLAGFDTSARLLSLSGERDINCTQHCHSTRGLASYTASLSCFTYTPRRHEEEIDSETGRLAQAIATPLRRRVMKFSVNFWPSYPPLTPQASYSPNHQARAQIHRRPAGPKACYMQQSIPTTALASYPPSAAQLWLNGRTCFCAVACVSVDDCDMNDTHLHPPEGESSDTYRQQQQRLTEGPGVHRPPAVVVMPICPTRRATPSVNSAQKNNHRKGQQSSDTRLGGAAKQRLAQPRKVQHDFCSHTPAFLPVCLIC